LRGPSQINRKSETYQAWVLLLRGRGKHPVNDVLRNPNGFLEKPQT
jgi:hypothetical protein